MKRVRNCPDSFNDQNVFLMSFMVCRLRTIQQQLLFYL